MLNSQDIKKLKLIPFQQSDFQTLINWITDEVTMLNFAGIGFEYPLTEEQLTSYIEKYPNRLIYMAVDGNSKPIAYGEIIPQDKFSARLGHLIIGESEQRGKGLGQELIRLLNEKARERLSIRQMDLFLLGGNLKAEKCYLKYGFSFVENDFQIDYHGKSYDILKMTLAL